MAVNPTDTEDAQTIVGAIESLEATGDVMLGHMRSIAESLGSIRDGIQRLSEAVAILVAKNSP